MKQTSMDQMTATVANFQSFSHKIDGRVSSLVIQAGENRKSSLFGNDKDHFRDYIDQVIGVESISSRMQIKAKDKPHPKNTDGQSTLLASISDMSKHRLSIDGPNGSRMAGPNMQSLKTSIGVDHVGSN